MHSHSLTDDSDLARLVDEVTEDLEARRAVDWDRYEAEWPQHVDKLRKLPPTLEAMVTLGPAPRELLSP